MEKEQKQKAVRTRALLEKDPAVGPRKEVIQPHLPVRLPCYDLAPVTSFTLDGSCDGHRLQVSLTSMA
jgi:hypothetical protein